VLCLVKDRSAWTQYLRGALRLLSRCQEDGPRRSRAEASIRCEHSLRHHRARHQRHDRARHMRQKRTFTPG
jgi:hypothetical protein